MIRVVTEKEFEELKSLVSNLQQKRKEIAEDLKNVENSLALAKVEVYLASNQCNYGDVVRFYTGIDKNRKECFLCIPHKEEFEEFMKTDSILLYERCFEVTKSGKASKKFIYHNLLNAEVVGSYNKETREITYF